MNHSIAELIDVARRYFPEGYWPEGYESSAEHERRGAAHARAGADYETWRSMLRRLRERFPDIDVRNESIRFEATESTPVDRCFAGSMELPPRRPEEQNHRLGFRVSFVVPYYFLYGAHQVKAPNDFDLRSAFDFTPDEAPVAKAVEEEIGRAFPLHARMGPEVGTVIVPNVATNLRIPGEASLYDCLFSDYW